MGPDDFVPPSYNAGFVVLSYLVSLAGCWTSLELLRRRTGARGYYNWYLLLAAASTMGAVAIWSMHYIGNRAISMASGSAKDQIQYSPSYTAGSFFLPIFVVGIAFYFFSTSEKVGVVSTVLGGILTGLAVCGMHYMGQGGILNYTPSYLWPYVLGSALVAVAATTVALGVFFYLNSMWTNSWWKRGLCASLLAVAVSGMHWTASVGTEYVLNSTGTKSMEGLSREATVVVVICLGVGCCLALFAFALVGQRSRQRSACRAQQVVLACATFDSEGRIMVTPEGLLPCRKITDSYLERSFEDVFDVDHPVFCWAFRVSRCWRDVADLIPSMRAHLRRTLLNKPNRHSDSPHSAALGSVSMVDYSVIFRELFCVAAKDLADLIQEPLDNVGVLYGGIMNTGTLGKSARSKIRSMRREKDVLDSAERGESPITFGRGQLLFLVRRVNGLGSSQLQSVGHRFATIPNVIDTLARSMEVTREELLPRLESMRGEYTEERFLRPGVHLACFALRPMFHRGFDVLVRKDASNMLPTTFLTGSILDQWQLEMLESMHDSTVATCCDLLRANSKWNAREQKFAGELLEGITQLAKTIDHPLFESARMASRPLKAPCVQKTGDIRQASQEVALISFRMITDAHEHSSLNKRYEFSPLRFFLCQQHCYKGCPDNNVFARALYREFAAIAKISSDADRRNTRDTPRNPSSDGSFGSPRSRSASPLKKRPWPARLNTMGPDAMNNFERNLLELGLLRPYGGIYVSNEVSVNVTAPRRGREGSEAEMTDLRPYSVVGAEDTESMSFADELMAMTLVERRTQRTTLTARS